MKSIWHEKILEILIGLIEKSPKKQMRIVDVGCDAGVVIRQIAQLYPHRIEAWGIDCRAAELEQGRCLASQIGSENVHFVNEYFLEMDPLKYGSFDFVIFSEVYEHLLAENQIKSLRIVGAMLNPDGKLIITVPNGDFLYSIERHKTFANKYRKDFFDDLRQTDHWLEPSMREMYKILISLGFDVHKMNYFKLPFSGRVSLINHLSKKSEQLYLLNRMLRPFWGHFYAVASKDANSPFFKDFC